MDPFAPYRHKIEALERYCSAVDKQLGASNAALHRAEQTIRNQQREIELLKRKVHELQVMESHTAHGN